LKVTTRLTLDALAWACSKRANQKDTLVYDVIVAGAGPVGLFLASELRLAKLSVLEHRPNKRGFVRDRGAFRQRLAPFPGAFPGPAGE
jgi:thioredoxin reductase